jgi:hypothetical protein
MGNRKKTLCTNENIIVEMHDTLKISNAPEKGQTIRKDKNYYYDQK